MIEIIPAVLPKDFDDLKEHLERVRGAATKVQVDVVDGHFAHNKTWPYKDHATFEKIISQEHGLPFWEEFDFEFDLMINNPEAVVMNYVHAAASRIIVHASAPGALDAARMLMDLKDDDYGEYAIKIGVAVPAESHELDPLLPFETMFDFVQVMGIDREGFQHQPFDAHSIAIVDRLRKKYPHVQIQVDGGVTMENAHALAHAGADRLVVGSAIFGTEDPKKALKDLEKEANKL